MRIERVFTALLAIICFACTAFGQQAAGGYVSGFKQTGNVLFFKGANADLRIEFCTANMFRVRTAFNRQFEADENWMVQRYNWPAVQVSAKEGSTDFSIESSQLSVTVLKQNLAIIVRDKTGKILSAEGEKNSGAYNIKDTVGCTKQLQPNEHFFGFGERMDFLDQRSKKLRLSVGRGTGLPHTVGAYNVNMANYCPVPFFMSTQGYGLFFHTAFASEWDMGASSKQTFSFRADGGELDYYFIYGPDFPAILNDYTSLTGKAPLLPFFALGLHVGTYSGGTWGYEQLTSDAYVIALAEKLRAMGIAVDVLHLDSVWRIFGLTGGKGATSFEWRPTFKDIPGMFSRLYKLNYKAVGMHVRPRFDNGNTYKLLDTAQKLGFTYPEKNGPGEFVNFFDQKAVDWWWSHGVKKLADAGAKFLKTDEGSAFGHLANESDKVGPTGKEVEKLHNLFPLAYAKAPFEKFAQYNSKPVPGLVSPQYSRGMNHTREGYAGIQRYPFIFAGDWPSEWQYFAPVIKAGLNIGLSGVGNWAHCMGGFEHVADPELYIRWTQFGLLSPVAHLFGMEHPNYKEPWNYGEEALRIFKKYDSLRYRLMPYLYNASYQNHLTGMPLMRALVLNWQDDENVYNITDQYMLGDHLMVCPVTTKGAATRTVYLPKGVWFDYWTGKKYTGEQYVHVVTPLDVLPMFVKAGGIIAMQPGMTYVGEKPVDEVSLDVFAGNGQFNLYEDDGMSLDYQAGKYSVTAIKTAAIAGGQLVEIAKPAGQFTPSVHTYTLRMYLDKAPATVLENGTPVKQAAAATDIKAGAFYYDAEAKTLWVKPAGKNDVGVRVEVKW